LTLLRWSARLAAALLLSAAGAVAAAPKPVSQVKPAAPAKSPAPEYERAFSNVPLAHPAYAALTQLEEAGVATGYPKGFFHGKRPVTRYEFAVAVAREYQQLGRAVKRLDPADPAPVMKLSGPPSWVPADAPELRTTLGDPSNLQRLLAWYEPLIVEFAAELAQLGADMGLMRKGVQHWKANAGRYADQTRTGLPGD
jgi:hypothetical protein